jgi:hypothetical protein
MKRSGRKGWVDVGEESKVDMCACWLLSKS